MDRFLASERTGVPPDPAERLLLSRWDVAKWSERLAIGQQLPPVEPSPDPWTAIRQMANHYAAGETYRSWMDWETWRPPVAKPSGRESMRQAAHRLAAEGLIELRMSPYGNHLEARLISQDATETWFL
jgi:hypothetical protein